MKFAISSEGSSIIIVHELLILLHRKGRIHFGLISRDLTAFPSAPVVDGVCGDTNIANLFAAQFSVTLNKHSSGCRSTLLSSV